MFYGSDRPTVAFIAVSNPRELRTILDGMELGWSQFTWNYQGQVQDATWVLVNTPQLLQLLLAEVHKLGQERILIRNSDSSIEWHYCSGQISRVKGRLQVVADTEEHWMLINEQYYSIA